MKSAHDAAPGFDGHAELFDTVKKKLDQWAGPIEEFLGDLESHFNEGLDEKLAPLVKDKTMSEKSRELIVKKWREVVKDVKISIKEDILPIPGRRDDSALHFCKTAIKLEVSKVDSDREIKKTRTGVDSNEETTSFIFGLHCAAGPHPHLRQVS